MESERTNNYDISADRAKEYFMKYSADSIIEKWQLSSDEEWMYVTFLGWNYKIRKSDREVVNLTEDRKVSFEEVLSIFDLLAHTEGKPVASNEYAGVNSLKGQGAQVGVGEGDFFGKYAKLFGDDILSFKAACQTLAGREIKLGDFGYEFDIFEDLKIRLKFYEADDEFPSSMMFFWNDNALEFIYYETAYYIMVFLCSRIEAIMGNN